jgi:hypothetical protein
VPIGLALAHQAGGLIVVAAAVWHLHSAVQSRISPICHPPASRRRDRGTQ